MRLEFLYETEINFGELAVELPLSPEMVQHGPVREIGLKNPHASMLTVSIKSVPKGLGAAFGGGGSQAELKPAQHYQPSLVVWLDLDYWSEEYLARPTQPKVTVHGVVILTSNLDGERPIEVRAVLSFASRFDGAAGFQLNSEADNTVDEMLGDRGPTLSQRSAAVIRETKDTDSVGRNAIDQFVASNNAGPGQPRVPVSARIANSSAHDSPPVAKSGVRREVDRAGVLWGSFLFALIVVSSVCYQHWISSAASQEPRLARKLMIVAPTAPELGYLENGSVHVRWTDVSGESGYNVERREGAGDYKVIAKVEANSVTYEDTRVEADRQYAYRISALTNSTQALGESSIIRVPLSHDPLIRFSEIDEGLDRVYRSLTPNEVRRWEATLEAVYTKLLLVDRSAEATRAKASVLAWRGVLAIRMGQFRRAVTWFDRSRQVDPTFDEARQWLAFARRQLRRRQQK